MKRYRILLLVLTAVIQVTLISGCTRKTPTTVTATARAPKLTGGRVGPARLYPDMTMTPGLSDTLEVSALVKSYTDHCKKGHDTCTYTESHRNVPDNVHDQVYIDYNVPKKKRNLKFGEVDHLCPVCAGGSNDKSNLWYQPLHNMWKGKNFGYKEKDTLESWICQQIKDKKLDPKVAYKRITEDWVSFYIEAKLKGAAEDPEYEN